MSYDKSAIQQFIDDLSGVRENMQRKKDESTQVYHSCQQNYSRLYTEVEEINRKAYNQLEMAESMQRTADAQYEMGMRLVENVEDADAISTANQQLAYADALKREAEQEMVLASANYAKTQEKLRKVTEIWDKYQTALESCAHKVEDHFSSINLIMEKGKSDLGEYMGIMDKAQMALYEGPSETGSMTESISRGNGNRNMSSENSKDGNSPSKLVNVIKSGGMSMIAVSLFGEEYAFPNTKTGVARAYRLALKSGDTELISATRQIFNGFSSNTLESANSLETIKQHGAECCTNISLEERESLKRYTGVSYANINATLRGIEAEFDPGNYENAKNIHNVLSRTELPCDCTVYRGVSSYALGDLRSLSDDELLGKVFLDRGFLSTSLERGSAFDGDLILQIHAPKGSNGMYVGYISSAGQYEEEVLFDINQNMRIDSVGRDDFGRRILDVTLLTS